MDSLSLADDLISSLSMNDSTGEDFSLYNIPFKIYVYLAGPYISLSHWSLTIIVLLLGFLQGRDLPLRVSSPNKIPVVLKLKCSQ